MFRSLRTKILAGFLLIIGMVGAIGAWAVIDLSKIQNETSDAVHQRFEILHAINILDTATSHLRGAATRFLLTPEDTALATDFARTAAASSAALSNVSTSTGPLSSSPGLYRSLYEISHLTITIQNELHYQLTPTVPADTGGTPAQKEMRRHRRNEIFVSEIDPLFDSLNSHISGVEEAYLASLGSLSAISQQEGNRIRIEVGIFGGLTLVLCILLAIRFSNIIVAPIVELTAKTKRITAGELNQLVIPRTNDEVGRLGEQFNAMAEKLGEFEELNLKKILEEKAISESIVQSMDDALMLIDRFGKVLSINRSAQELFDLTNAEGRNALDVSRGKPALESLCTAALKGSWRESNRGEIVEYGRHEKRIFLMRDIIPIQSGEFPGTVAFLLVLRDITQAHELERMRSDFVGMV